MKILQISDTHNRHRQLTRLPKADVIIHCGDFTEYGTENEVLDFLNWFIELPYRHKIFVTGNHDICLWDAENIEDLPSDVHFLQDSSCEIEHVKFFGLAYNHDERLIPNDVDVLVTHEPPIMILDNSGNTHWGKALLRNTVYQIKPHYHLFGHAHENQGIAKDFGIVFANGAVLDDNYNMRNKYNLLVIDKTI